MHEFLIKPTSPKALQDRLTSILLKPRPMMKVGALYVPQPWHQLDGAELAKTA